VRRCGCAIALTIIAPACASAPPDRWTEPTTGIVFARIPAGGFAMGSPADEPGHQDNETPHRVRLTRAFYLSTTEVTRAQWAALMPPVAADLAASDLPVVNVNWFDANAFVEKLNANGSGRFRLPTEAEWEYACRAGTTTPYSTGAALSTDHANYNGDFPLPGQARGRNRAALSHAGSFPPNLWGLSDMHGNAWEWTADPLCAYPAGPVVDPAPSCDAALKVIRGGSWRFNADSARCALRYTHRPQDRGDSLGFRVLREIATNEERRTKN
jgi:formylglycine-generating enzyme required for sulfatase activity